MGGLDGHDADLWSWQTDTMSNDQWNNNQGNQWVPQPDAGASPQRSANEWAQQPADQWGQQPQQPSGNEWGQQQPSANEWGQQAQQQPAGEWQQGQSANEWAQQQAQQGWDQQAQQGWGQQQPQQGWDQQQAWQQQQWQGGAAMPAGSVPAQVAPSGGSPFDFSFRELSLPKSASAIWIIVIVCLLIEWLLGFIPVLAYDQGALSIAQILLGGLAGVAAKALVVRVLLEIGIALVRVVEQTKKDEA